MNQDVMGIGRQIGYQLKEVQAVLRARMDEVLRPLGLTTPQYACLTALEQTRGASNSELARRAFVTRQTMNVLLHGLEARGLVARAEEAPHGRARPVSLTQEGSALLTQAAEAIGVVVMRMVGSLDDMQRTDLHDALNSCIEALR